MNKSANFDYPQLNRMNVQDFYNTYRGYVYSIVRCEGLDHSYDNEVMDNILIRIFMKGGIRYTPEKGRFSNYLHSMARNCCRTIKRGFRHYVNVEDQDVAALKDHGVGDSRRYPGYDEENRDIINKAFGILESRVRNPQVLEAYKLNLQDGMRPMDIDKKLNVAPGYASVAIKRCSERLQNILRTLMAA